MDLSAGAYTVRGGAADSIRVRWETRNSRERLRPHRRRRQAVQMRRSGARPEERLPRRPGRSGGRRHSDGRECRRAPIRGIEGNKSVSMWAGEVTMEVGDAQLYRRVDTTVRVPARSRQPRLAAPGRHPALVPLGWQRQVHDCCEAFCRRSEVSEVGPTSVGRPPPSGRATPTPSPDPHPQAGHPSAPRQICAILPESVEVSPLLQPPRQCRIEPSFRFRKHVIG